MELGLWRYRQQQSLWYWVGFCALLLLFTIGVTVPYISSQHAFLGGDINDGFYQRTIEVTQLFEHSPWQAIQTVFAAANNTYNKFYTLPLIPLILILGNSYLAYVTSVAIVYLLPLNLMIGLLATQLIPGSFQTVFVSSVLLANLISSNWVTVLIGHPDIGATLLTTIAIWVCLYQVKRNFSWLLSYRWQVPVLGFLLAIAILFRRHFAYADMALIGAMLLQTAIVFLQELRQSVRKAWRNLLIFGIRFSLVLATCLATLAIVAPEFTRDAFTTNYVTLYDSWSRSFNEVIQFYGSLYGWGFWLLVAVGWLIGLATKILSPAIATFVVGYGGFSIAIWLFKLRYTETYYAIHFVPFLILGLVALVWTIVLKLEGIKKNVVLGLISVFLVCNFVMGLTSIVNLPNSVRPWFAVSYPPPVRQNYDTIVELTEYLRKLALHGEPIFVVHSDSLPKHLIQAAERTQYGDDGSILKLKSGSLIDSIGYYSIQELLEAKYVLITQPFLEWNKGQQDTAKVVIDAFNEQWEITQDFQPLPQKFDLGNGAATTIYHRIQSTSIDRAVRTLHQMQQRVNKPLGKQLNWVVVSQPFHSAIKSTPKGEYMIRVKPFPENADLSESKAFLYLGELADQSQIKAQVQFQADRCPSVALKFSALNAQGQVLHTSDPVALGKSSSIDSSISTANADYLLMEVVQPDLEPTTPDRCRMRINDLKVSPQVK